MELDGTEKRIQALFSELSLEDRTRLPRFERLWTQTTSPVPLFRRSWAVTAAVVVIVAASSFALWSSKTVLNIAPLEIPTPAPPQLASIVDSSQSPQSHRQKRTIRRQTHSVSLNEAALLSSWQSPTQSFMQSPSSVSFNSLPQLNQSAKDLESFLPKKESNQ